MNEALQQLGLLIEGCFKDNVHCHLQTVIRKNHVRNSSDNENKLPYPCFTT